MPSLLVNRLASSEAFVYHYTSLRTAIKYLLPSGKLRMNTLAGVNDPRENKQWEMLPLLPVDESRSYKEYDDDLPGEFRTTCYLRMAPCRLDS